MEKTVTEPVAASSEESFSPTLEQTTKNLNAVDTVIEKEKSIKDDEKDEVDDTTELIKTIEVQHFLGEVGTSKSSKAPAQLVEFQSFSSVPVTLAPSVSVRRRGKELRLDDEEEAEKSNEVHSLEVEDTSMPRQVKEEVVETSNEVSEVEDEETGHS